MIDGVVVKALRRITDERGVVSHMLRSSDEHFVQFGEIYFSSIHPGVVKGWHRHRPAVLNYACIVGCIKLVLFDDREESPTRGELMELFIGDSDYSLVSVPAGVWNGFKAVGTQTAIVANCCTHEHGEFDSERMDPFGGAINYDWAARSH